jgi:hypothetical protein
MTRRIQLLTLMMLCATISLQAQSREVTAPQRRAKFTLPKSDIQLRQSQDTIFYPAASEDCGNFVFIYPAGDEWGYVGGTNGYGDIEKAQKLTYTANTPYTIKEVWGYFSNATAVGNGLLRMKVYTVDALTGAPDSLLGQSDSLRTSNLKTDSVQVPATVFRFSRPVVVRDTAFFVSADISALYTARDTVALFMTEADCGDGADAWERFSDSTWVAIDSTVSWEIESNWVVAAVVEFNPTTGINDPFVANQGLRLFPAAPNPTSDWIELPYEIENASRITIEVYSADGKVLRRLNRGQQASGLYKERLNVNDLAPGTYVYGIITDETRMMSRFVVAH